jgi:hypothetical protein
MGAGAFHGSLVNSADASDWYDYSFEGTGSSNSKFANDMFFSSGVSSKSVLMSPCTSSGNCPRYFQTS